MPITVMRHSHSTHYSSAGHSVNPAHSAHSSSSDRSQYATHNGVPGGDYTQHQHPTTPYYGHSVSPSASPGASPGSSISVRTSNVPSSARSSRSSRSSSHVPHRTVISLCSDGDRDALFNSTPQQSANIVSKTQEVKQVNTTADIGAGPVNGRTYGVSNGVSNGAMNGHTPAAPPAAPPMKTPPKPAVKPTVIPGDKEGTNGKHGPPSPPPKPIHHSWPYHDNTASDYYYVEDKTTKSVSKPSPSPITSHTGSGQNSTEQHPYFTSGRDMKKPDTMREMRIVSTKGTVRGYKNRVRAGIANILDTEKNKQLRQKEIGKIVLYTTSMSVVRDTYEHCTKVRRILQTHMVQFEERDIFMSKDNQTELIERLGCANVDVPQVFADGNHLGDVIQLDAYNESGELKKIFAHFTKLVNSSSCEKCGGYRFVNCTTCHGSKKSLHRNNFTTEFSALRCVNCDENGLVKCNQCTD